MLLFLCILCLLEIVCSQTYPSNVLLPSSTIAAVSFTCTGSPPLRWRVNNTTFDVNSITPPGISFVASSVGMQIYQALVVQEENVLSYNGSSFQCSTHGDSFSSVPTAFIIVYGKFVIDDI